MLDKQSNGVFNIGPLWHRDIFIVRISLLDQKEK